MNLQCEVCGKMFEHSGPGGLPKYCPECRNLQKDFLRERRARKQRERRRRKTGHGTDFSPGQGMRSVLQEMEIVNATRRAEGKPIVTYGKFIAIRDKRMPDREHP